MQISAKLENRPISVNSQPGGQNNKIVLHLKGLFLSEEKTTIVCPPDWELLKWVYSVYQISTGACMTVKFHFKIRVTENFQIL